MSLRARLFLSRNLWNKSIKQPIQKPTFCDGIVQTESEISVTTAESSTQHETLLTEIGVQTASGFSQNPVNVYIDVENGCREFFKYFLMDIMAKSATNVTVNLYTGNISQDTHPTSLQKLNFVKYMPNKIFLKELADVMLTTDVYELFMKDPCTKLIIVAGSDARYQALQYVMKSKGANIHLVRHVDAKPENVDKTLSLLWKIYNQ